MNSYSKDDDYIFHLVVKAAVVVGGQGRDFNILPAQHPEIVGCSSSSNIPFSDV